MKENETGKYNAESPENDEVEDFATLFEASQTRKLSREEDQNKVVADIVSIGDEWIFVDIGGKTEGIISKEEFIDEKGELTLKKGDSIAAYFIKKTDGEIVLSRKMTMAASSEALREAYERGIPVEGLVVEERKGGFSVKVLGKNAFCPYSQIDSLASREIHDYIGKKFSFKITEYTERGKNIVLSRRRVLDEERLERIEELKKSLSINDIVDGIVKKIESFGAFAEIGGIEGLIPISEISWGRTENVSDVLSLGQHVRLRIINLDWDKNRITLSLKQATDDPWLSVESRYLVGSKVVGRISRLANFGAFLELEPGIEGLIHISNLGQGKRINHPREIVSVGSNLEAKILSIDSSAKRIGLELERAANDVDNEAPVELRAGQILDGIVETIQDYGLFVKLPGGKSGLLHLSEIDGARNQDLKRRFPLGTNLEVQVLALDEANKKISLSLKAMGLQQERQQMDEFFSGSKTKQSFGTLGDLLKEKLSMK